MVAGMRDHAARAHQIPDLGLGAVEHRAPLVDPAPPPGGGGVPGGGGCVGGGGTGMFGTGILPMAPTFGLLQEPSLAWNVMKYCNMLLVCVLRLFNAALSVSILSSRSPSFAKDAILLSSSLVYIPIENKAISNSIISYLAITLSKSSTAALISIVLFNQVFE